MRIIYPGILIASSANVAIAPDAIPTKILFESLGNFFLNMIATEKIATTEGIIATYVKVVYSMIPSGGNMTRLAEAPDIMTTKIDRENSFLVFFTVSVTI